MNLKIAKSVFKANRVYSIDAFRALTMLLMIFVNDLWTLRNIPDWLGHKPAEVDGLGLADVVFPAFLFIVGLSIPFAITVRQKKEYSTFKILQHILERSFALILMGFFMVNLESVNTELLPFSKSVWQLLMVTSFFLIWLYYKGYPALKRYLIWLLRIIGFLILIYLAYIYRGGTTESPVWMKPHWWGILGLIGWAYLVCSIVYLIAGNRVNYIALALFIFHILNIQEFVSFWEPGRLKIVVSASNHASVMAGVLASVILIQITKTGKTNRFITSLFVLTAILMIYGFIVRPIGGISKIKATPSWTAICSGINFTFFAILFIVVDIWRKKIWYTIIKPAGTSTLTCYLIPYYVYAFAILLGLSLPLSLRSGILGIIKSVLFSLLIVLATGLLEKIKIRLKI